MEPVNLYSVTAKTYLSIAHSLPSEKFSKARNLHGATYTIIVSIFARQLDENNLVIDLLDLERLLEETIDPLNYRNLDEVPQFKEKLTTTEYLAKYIFETLKARFRKLISEKKVNPSIEFLKIELKETDNFSASFLGELHGGNTSET